ncbi:hypothetical protein J5N97_013474 [Dioscorea zingiberensis]|uniref:Uncharacterized protein n=1 Tax=Dioscorea zingiberensis TaxID=325984 RepID=A0A9D5HIN8_9LILI|nr:hypothetical protein J5N97_013474 [Dioscorea zingiberensis]
MASMHGKQPPFHHPPHEELGELETGKLKGVGEGWEKLKVKVFREVVNHCRVELEPRRFGPSDGGTVWRLDASGFCPVPQG